MKAAWVAIFLWPLSALAQNTDQPLIPNGATPPYGITLYVGFKAATSQADKQAFSAKFTTLNNQLWDISHGQMSIHKVKFYDTVTGTGSIQNPGGMPKTIDIWVKAWNDEPAQVLGYVMFTPSVGRVGRIMVLPLNPGASTLVHESGHFIWQLSWSAAPGLTDEYADGQQDNACTMELRFNPLRWCYTDNHIPQSSQPHSCWEQIEKDYPNFKFSATANGAAPVPQYEYYSGPPGTQPPNPVPTPNNNNTTYQPPIGIPGIRNPSGSGHLSGQHAALSDTTSKLCFVATATYGSAQAEPVVALQTFRKEALETNAFGSTIMNAYTSCAPAPAMEIGRSTTLRELSATLLGAVIPLAGSSSLHLALVALGALAGVAALKRRWG